MLLPLEPLMDVALEPVVDVPAEPVTGALGATGALLGVVLPGMCWADCRHLTAQPSALPPRQGPGPPVGALQPCLPAPPCRPDTPGGTWFFAGPYKDSASRYA